MLPLSVPQRVFSKAASPQVCAFECGPSGPTRMPFTRGLRRIIAIHVGNRRWHTSPWAPKRCNSWGPSGAFREPCQGLREPSGGLRELPEAPGSRLEAPGAQNDWCPWRRVSPPRVSISARGELRAPKRRSFCCPIKGAHGMRVRLTYLQFAGGRGGGGETNRLPFPHPPPPPPLGERWRRSPPLSSGKGRRAEN
jgi:hypothetical protein